MTYTVGEFPVIVECRRADARTKDLILKAAYFLTPCGIMTRGVDPGAVNMTYDELATVCHLGDAQAFEQIARKGCGATIVRLRMRMTVPPGIVGMSHMVDYLFEKLKGMKLEAPAGV